MNAKRYTMLNERGIGYDENKSYFINDKLGNEIIEDVSIKNVRKIADSIAKKYKTDRRTALKIMHYGAENVNLMGEVKWDYT